MSPPMNDVGFNSRWPSATIINSCQEWNEVERQFVETITGLGMIGLDCEWVEPNDFDYKEDRDQVRYTGRHSRLLGKVNAIRIDNGSNGKVALLQVASHGGMVLLIRLCLFAQIPQSLKELLEDGKILKLGVNIEVDAKRLFTDWGVNTNGFVDIRNVFVRNPRFLEEYHKSGLGLKKLGNFLTGSNVCDESSDNTVRYSHWACQELSPEQIQYARNDAIAAVEGMFCFATKYMVNLPPSSASEFGERLRQALRHDVNRPCSDYVTHILEKKKEVAVENGKPAVSKKNEERRRRRETRMAMDNSDSDIEFDYERWKKSDHCKKAQMREGLERAVVFRDSEETPLAAIDSALLYELKDIEEGQRVCFDVKNTRGDAIYEVRMELRMLTD